MGRAAAHRLARTLEGIGVMGTLRYFTRAAGVLVTAVLLGSIFTSVATLLGTWTAAPFGVGPADAIVVLGAGAATPPGILDGASLRKAVYGSRLYRENLAPLLVLSGGPDQGDERGEARLRVELARDLGVPTRAILAETTPRPEYEPTTHNEVHHLRNVLVGKGVRKILLVTDSQHMRRAGALFEQAGLAVLPAPIDEVSLDATSAEERLKLMRWIGQEWLARLYYAALR